VDRRRLARKLVDRAPRSTRVAVGRWLTRLHGAAAAQASTAHELARRSARARAHDWGFYTLYLPGVDAPLYARPGTSDLMAFHAIFGRRQHAVDLGFVPRVVFDLGANVGYAAVDFALRYPGARVVAVEPERANVEMMRLNVAPYPQIDVVEAAVWPRPGTLVLEAAEVGEVGFRVREVDASKDAVAAVTVPALMERAGVDAVDVVKIDIEGSEVELLTEEADWLGAVRAVVVEFHDWFRPGAEKAGEAALERADLAFYEDHGGTRYYVRRAPS
jgi:FkbM family methyltransferase